VERVRVSQGTYVSQCLHPTSVQWVCPILRHSVKIHVYTVHVYIHRCLANRTITGYISFYLPITSSPIRLTAQSYTRCTNPEPFTIRHLDAARFNTITNTSLRNFPLKSPTGRFRWSCGARSKAWICCLSLAGMMDSNPAGGIDVCLLRELYAVFVTCRSLVQRSPACVYVCRWMRLGGNNPLHLQWAGRQRPEYERNNLLP